jgi:uncharacterized protein (TIGR03437 family)
METQSLPRPKPAIAVRIGGRPADVIYCGAGPYSWAGLLMCQAKVPTASATGNSVPVRISAGGTNSPDGISMAVKQ